MKLAKIIHLFTAAVFLGIGLAGPSVGFAAPIIAWGTNTYGALEAPDGNDYVAIDGGFWHGVALKADGTLVAWGYNAWGQCNVPAGNDYIAVAGGGYHCLALKADGTLVAWGRNVEGQLNVPPGDDFVAISAGSQHNLALRSDGSLAAAGGLNDVGELNVPPGNDFVAIAAGYHHNVALRADGSLVAWGWNIEGQCDVPSGNNYMAVAAGAYHSLALKTNRSIVAWGITEGDYGYLGQTDVPAGNNFVDISTFLNHSVALRADGSLVGWGYAGEGATNVPAGNDFSAIATGWSYSAALGAAGSCDFSGTVYDVTTGAPIVAADVSVAGQASTQTNTFGTFSLTGVNCGLVVVTATKTGYSNVSETVLLPWDSPTVVSIAMTPATSGVTEVRGRYSGPGKHAYYLDGVSLTETFTATVNWGGDTPGVVRWITPSQQFEDPCPGTTVTRSFDMGADFGVEGRLTVLAVSGDSPPVEYSPYVVNFKVISLPFGMPNLGWTVVPSNQLKYVLGTHEVSLPSEGVGEGGIPDWMPVFGGQPYEVGLKFKLAPEVRGDGTGTAGVITITGSGEDDAPGKFGGVGWEMSMGGEATWMYDGSQWQVGGTLQVGLDASKDVPSKPKYTIVFVWVVPVPVYWQGHVGVEADASLGFDDWHPDPMLPTLNGQLTIAPKGGVRVGVGAADVAAFEGNLGGSAPFVLQYPAEPALVSISIGFSGSLKLVVWTYVREWPILDYTWDLYQGGSDPLGEKLHGGDDWSGFTLLPRDYLGPDYAVFHPEGLPSLPSGRGSRGVETALQTNVFPYLAPCLAAVGDESRLVWLYDDPERTSVNSTEVVFSASAEGLWSEPVAVVDDGTADFAPTLAALPSGDLLAAWENADAVLPDETDIETLASHLEIAVASFDELGQIWSSQINLTSNGFLDRSPRLSVGSNGLAMLTWVSNVSNDPIGSSLEPNTVHYSLWDGVSWSAPGVVAADVSSIVKSAMAFDGSNALYLYSADMDDDLDTVDDLELYAITFDGAVWSVPQRLTNEPDIIDDNPQVVAIGAGQFLFAWFRNEEIVTAGSLDLADLAVAATPGRSGGPLDFRLAQSETGQVTLVWQMASADGVDIWQALYDAGLDVWSNPLQLVFDDAMERFMSPAYLANGDLMIAYGKQHVSYTTRTLDVGGEQIVLDNVPVPEQTDLCVLRHTAEIDLAVFAEDVTLFPESPTAGDAVTITATVRNVGELPVTGMDVAFYDGDPGAGGIQMGLAETIAGPLVGEGEAEASLIWVVPDSTEPHDFYVVVDPNLAQDDGDRTNNTAVAAGVMKPDLTIDAVLVQSAGTADRIITIRVANASGLEVANTEVTLRRDAENGDLLATLAVTDPLAPRTFRDVSWVWEGAAPFPGGSVEVFAIADEANTVDEFDEANNIRGAVLGDDVPTLDCNLNGYDDALDIATGTSNDCNGNGIPDECEWADCNENGILDECDIAAGMSEDCNSNGIPDECEWADCNENGILDACDIAAGTSVDTNENGIPDECEDCNSNGILDDEDIAAGTSEDCNLNGVPDECDIAGGTSTDCQPNGIPDECDIGSGVGTITIAIFTDEYPDETTWELVEQGGGVVASGGPYAAELTLYTHDITVNYASCFDFTIYDDCGDGICCDYGEGYYEVYGNGTLVGSGGEFAASETVANIGGCSDCNDNGIPDECEVPPIGEGPDCNNDGIPDECQLAGNDCNTNGIPDECDIAAGTSDDCNGNESPDECDIAGGSSADDNGNGIPDECAAGALVAWGWDDAGQLNVPGGYDYVAVAAGLWHSLALKTDGSIVAWGGNTYGQLNVPAGNDFEAISASRDFTLALKADGTIVGWGDDGDGQVTNVPGGNDYVAIAAGDWHGLALKADGSLVGWGWNTFGQATVPAGNDYAAISAGERHSLALKTDGSLAVWGDNTYGQLSVPAGDDYVAIAAGGWHSLALKADGSLVGWGLDYHGQVTMPAGNDFIAISAGYWWSLALKSDGSLAAWGCDWESQIANLPGGYFAAIVAGSRHGLALVGVSEDCNLNGYDDTSDIIAGVSQDENGNGIPDECELNPDQLHVIGPIPNQVHVGAEGTITATVQAGFVGLPGREVVFHKLVGDFTFTAGTVAPNGLQATTWTNTTGTAQMTFTADGVGSGLIGVTVAGTNLPMTYAVFEIVPPPGMLSIPEAPDTSRMLKPVVPEVFDEGIEEIGP